MPVVAMAVDAAVRGMTVGLLLLAAVLLARERPVLPAARLGLALLLGLVVQVVSSTPLLEATLPRGWQAPLVAVSVANAPLFALFVRALFDDGFVLRPWHGLLWLGAALLGAVNCAGLAAAATPLASFSVGLQRAVPLLAAAASAWAAARHWQDDLVEDRRRLRLFILVTGVAYTLVMAGVRIGASQGRLDMARSALDAALLLALAAGLCLRLLRLQPSTVFPLRVPVQPAAGSAASALTDPPAATPAAADAGRPASFDGPTTTDRPAADTAAAGVPTSETAATARTARAADSHTPADPTAADDDRLAAALHQLMTLQHAYRDEGLTLGGLATRLAVPEYRLRRVINQRLGHRNFSAYVNGLRLAEARRRLADPAEREQPVLGLALDVGFGSIGPFNRAFKVDTGLTPTEYRRLHMPPLTPPLADS